MKIDKSFQSVTTVSASDGRKHTDAAPTSNIKEESNVHLSSNASKLQNSSTDSSIANTARVQEIKQAISEGSFQINSKAVADQLIETVKELIQSQKGNT